MDLENRIFGRASLPCYHQALLGAISYGGEGAPHHELLDGRVLLCLPARGRLLVHDLHTDVVLGRHHTLEIWGKREMEKGQLVQGRDLPEDSQQHQRK